MRNICLYARGRNEVFIVEMKESADGPCDVPGSSGLREGFVYRSQDGKQSFKNVSRKYLLKHEE